MSGHVAGITTRVRTLPAGSVSTTTTIMETAATWITARVGQQPLLLPVTHCLHVPRAETGRGTAEPRPRRVALTPGTRPYSEVWLGPGAGAVDGRKRETRPREHLRLSTQVNILWRNAFKLRVIEIEILWLVAFKFLMK